MSWMCFLSHCFFSENTGFSNDGEANALRGKLAGCYKIKLRSAGFRLVYEVDDGEILILVVGVGKRERDAAYTQVEKNRQNAGK